MAINSKQKGKRGELELSHVLNSYGYDTRRSVQYNGKEEEGQPDLVGLPGIHVECKYTNSLRLYKAVEQSVRDTESTGRKELPVVFHRQTNKEWLAIMPLSIFMQLYQNQKEPITGGITNDGTNKES